jgi:hypothetical protein
LSAACPDIGLNFCVLVRRAHIQGLRRPAAGVRPAVPCRAGPSPPRRAPPPAEPHSPPWVCI